MSDVRLTRHHDNAPRAKVVHRRKHPDPQTMLSKTQSTDTGETTNEQLIYAPILRDGSSERNVVRQFGGLQQFTEQERGGFYTVIEAISEEDLNNLNVYQSAADRVLVDVPTYLAERENKYSEAIKELIKRFGSAERFLSENNDQIPVPIISGSLTTPIPYENHLTSYQHVSDNYNSVAIRLFIRPTEFHRDQKKELQKIESEINSNDLLLFDFIETSRLESGKQGYENIQYLCELFKDNTKIVMNAFSSYDGVNYNFGPNIAKDLGAEGFGDFAINFRFPEEVPLGKIDTRKIRQYSPSESKVAVFEGNGYANAFKKLEEWDRWDPTHCEFCRRAARQDTEWDAFWRRVRMGHYISAALEEEAL